RRPGRMHHGQRPWQPRPGRRGLVPPRPDPGRLALLPRPLAATAELTEINPITHPMNVELINTGSELMLGRVLNTHQQWLCRQLADLGYVVARQVAVPDTGNDIQQAVR